MDADRKESPQEQPTPPPLENRLAQLPPLPPSLLPRPDLMAPLFARGASVQVIQGEGGVGKTQLAIAYAHALVQTTGVVPCCWVISADSYQLENAWRNLGKSLGLDLQDKSAAEQYRAIKEALYRRDDWLLILDNVKNKTILSGLLPKYLSSRQRILITTRSRWWGSYPVLVVPPFTPAESQYYVQQHLTPEQSLDSAALAETLSHLPLALAHAVAYIKQANHTTEDYLALYRQKYSQLFTPGIRNKSDYAHHSDIVLTTCQLSIEQLATQNPLAAEWVKCCAYLHPVAIQPAYLQTLSEADDNTPQRCLQDVQRSGLLCLSDAGLSMHRFAQAAIRHLEATHCQPALRLQRLQSIAHKLHTLCEKHEEDSHPLLPHLEALAHCLSPFVKKETEESQEKPASACQASLFSRIGEFYWNLAGASDQAVVYWEKAFAIRSAVYGKEPHPDMATSHYCLGLAYEHSDKPRATNHYQLALTLNLTRYPNIDLNPAKYLDISAIYNNLGNIHFDSDCFQEALPYYLEDLRICQTIYGETAHIDTAGSHYNLGKAYTGLNDLPVAQTHLKAALSLYQQLSEQHKINETTKLLDTLQWVVSRNALIATKAQDRRHTQNFGASASPDFDQPSDEPAPATEEDDDELTYV